MPDSNLKPAPPKRKRWLRWLAWFGGSFVVLLVVLYFVVTSGGFFKSVILPRVSKILGADVTVADASISPFSHVLLHNLKIQPHGADPLLTATEVRASYSLWSIIKGNIVVEEAAVESPVITVTANADGSGNLEALLKAQTKDTKPAPTKPASPSKPAQLDIKKVTLNNGTVRFVKNYPGGAHDLSEVTGLNFSVSGLKNGQSGKIEFSAAIGMEKAAQPSAPAGALQAKVVGGIDFALTPDLKPGSARGNVSVTVGKTGGSMTNLEAVAVKFDCELSPTELKQVALSLSKDGALLGGIRLSGPFDTAKSEGKLRLEIPAIDKHALNLIGAASGIDFGTTTISATNDIEISKGGSLISVAGRLLVAQFQVTRQGQTSPTLDVRGEYAVTVDQTASSAVIKTLNLTGTQNSRPLLQGGLSSPMTIAWDASSNAVSDAALNLVVTNLSLLDWKQFAGDSAPEGIANLKVKLVSQKAGQQLAFDLDTRLDQIATGKGDARVNQGDLHAQVRGSAADFKQFKLDDYQLELSQQGKSALKVSGSGTFNGVTQDADIQLAFQTVLGRFMGPPGGNSTNGAVDFKGRVTYQGKKATLAGKLAFAPSARAKNELQLDGTVDMSNPLAIGGNVKLAVDSLDLSPYYDLLPTNKTAVARPPSAASSPGSEKEPAPIILPLKNFALDLQIKHLVLREVDIANWQTSVLLDGSHVLVKPCQLTLNNGPITASADLDLGVAGYKYNVTFNAGTVPLAPFVDSFVPTYRGRVAGTLGADAQISGAGITGASLQKNLAGQFNVAATNLNLSITNVHSPLVMSIVNVVVGIPDLIRDPTAAIGNLFGELTGANVGKGGWSDTLKAVPIDVISMNARAGDGLVRLQQSEIRSKAFQALASGEITLTPVLTNSAIKIPVKIALASAMATQIGLSSSGTPATAGYSSLPDFVTMTGTVGKPKTDINKLAIFELAAKASGGVGKNIGGAGFQKAGSLINDVGGLFGGKSTPAGPPGTNSTNTTNAPANPSVLDLFKKPK